MTMTTKCARVVVVLTVPAVFGACGASGGAAPAEKPAATGGAAGPAQQSGRAPAAVFKKGNPCSVLLPNEVGQILGVSISMREIVDEVTCSFPFEAPPAPAGRGTAASPTSEAGAKSMAAAMVGAEPQLTIIVHWDDGPTAVTATRMASKLFGGDAGFEKLQGIGDEAWLGPMASILVFSKGKVGIEIDLRLIPDAREKGIRLAKLIASRLP